jgi:hypothetical protein
MTEHERQLTEQELSSCPPVPGYAAHEIRVRVQQLHEKYVAAAAADDRARQELRTSAINRADRLKEEAWGVSGPRP